MLVNSDPQQQISRIASGITMISTVASTPLYFCGGEPSDPGENAHSGARYSSSIGCPPPPLIARSA